MAQTTQPIGKWIIERINSPPVGDPRGSFSRVPPGSAVAQCVVAPEVLAHRSNIAPSNKYMAFRNRRKEGYWANGAG